MEFVNLGVSFTVECAWNGTAAVGGQFLRKRVLGREGILCKRAWSCELPGKHSWLSVPFSSRMIFPCFLLIQTSWNSMGVLGVVWKWVV